MVFGREGLSDFCRLQTLESLELAALARTRRVMTSACRTFLRIPGTRKRACHLQTQKKTLQFLSSLCSNSSWHCRPASGRCCAIYVASHHKRALLGGSILEHQNLLVGRFHL